MGSGREWLDPWGEVVAKLAWRKTRISLVETGRVRVEPSEVVALADLYKLSSRDRGHLLEHAELAGMTSIADELGWVTAHIFRKTTATILRDSGQTLEQVADQLGHAFTSTTADDYIGRKVRNPEAAAHLDAVLKAIHEHQRQEPEGPAI